MELDFERQAMLGDPMPKKLDIADSCAYIALKYLYLAYKNKLMTRQEAKKEKDVILYNYFPAKSALIALNRDNEKLRNKIGEQSEEYKNHPSIQNADKLYAAFYNLPENWRECIEK